MVVTLSPPQISAKSFCTGITTHNHLTFHQFIHNSTKFIRRRNRPNGIIRAYIENTNPISRLASKVIGSLPVVGLIARLANDEGGLGGDIIDFAEFRRRVGNKCTITDSRAFYEFQDRRGRAGDPLYVLLCCWLAAVGAGLLKSEEILEGAARLSISNDIEFEEQNFIAKMTEAKEILNLYSVHGTAYLATDVEGKAAYVLTSDLYVIGTIMDYYSRSWTKNTRLSTDKEQNG